MPSLEREIPDRRFPVSQSRLPAEGGALPVQAGGLATPDLDNRVYLALLAHDAAAPEQ